jgi:hypothetical protein
LAAKAGEIVSGVAVAGSFGRPRAAGVRKLTEGLDTVPDDMATGGFRETPA